MGGEEGRGDKGPTSGGRAESDRRVVRGRGKGVTVDGADGGRGRDLSPVVVWGGGTCGGTNPLGRRIVFTRRKGPSYPEGG